MKEKTLKNIEKKPVYLKNSEGELHQYNAEQINIIHNEKGDYQNGPFFTAFCTPFHEIANNKNLGKIDCHLLFKIFAYMGDSTMMIEPNVQRLLGVKDYAKEINTYYPNIITSFKKLEEFGYIKRDKKRKDLHILINPAIATHTGARKGNYTRVWNQLALPFGNTPRKEKKKQLKQDWSSKVPEQLENYNAKRDEIKGQGDMFEE